MVQRKGKPRVGLATAVARGVEGAGAVCSPCRGVRDRECVARLARPSGLPYRASRSAMSFVWWCRSLEGLEESFSRCGDDPELTNMWLEKGDPVHIVAWRRWRCGMRGLLARVVGGRRVSLARRSPGVGVDRRSARVASARRRVVLPRDCVDEAGLRPAKCQRVAGVDGVALRDAGSELDGLKQKCLQVAVVALTEGKERLRMRRMLVAACGNDGPSGASRHADADCNLYIVGHCLRVLGKSVLVVGAESRAEFLRGEVSGKWCLGCQTGERLGCLVWSMKERHVYVMEDARTGGVADFCARVRVDPKVLSPWQVCAVGAAKKTRET